MGEWAATGGAIVGRIIFALLIIIGLILDLPGLFGNWIILIAMAGVWIMTGFEHFGWPGMLIMLIFALVGEGLEFLLAGVGARQFGGSKGAMIAALAGCLAGAVLGTPVFPVIGTLIGACVGAFAAAALYEYIQHEKHPKDAAWTGFGAALGKIGGILAKFCCGLAMLATAFFTF